VSNVPEIESVTRIDRTRAYLAYKNKSVEKFGVCADKDYFDVFNAKVLSGNPSKLFPDNNSIVVSDEMARLLFGNEDAVGKVVSLNLKMEYKVTGVFAAFPSNSSISYVQYVIPFHARRRDPEELQAICVKLNGAASRHAVEKKIDLKLREILEDDASSILFCFTDWRLHWSFENGKESGGRIVYIVIFSLTALFILTMACVNYINLSTARSAVRGREIAIRKMTGATRPALIWQFICETLAITCIATSISLMLAYILLPEFSQLMEARLTFSIVDSTFLIGLLAIMLFTGLLAGSYPAFLLSSFKPAVVLKGTLYPFIAGAGLRKALAIFQFALSAILIFCTVTVQQQINFLLKKDLGFDKNNVLIVDIDPRFGIPLYTFKSELMRSPVVLSAGISDSSPIEINGAAEVQLSDRSNAQALTFNGASCDEDYLPTIGLKFLHGRNFSSTIPPDSVNFIITQKGAELLGYEDPIGQVIKFDLYHEQEGKIIGVIQDFHNEDIHVPANPVIFSYRREEHSARIFVRYQEGKLDDALEHSKAVFDKFQPAVPMQYGFLDRDFENQFYYERVLRRFTICFTVIGIVINCLGLLGLSIFNTQRRIKEIAVRKILGATMNQIMMLLYRDFAKPVTIAFLVAFPIAYYLMSTFLEAYPFRIKISFFDFLTVVAIMIGVVTLTVSLQSFRAAAKNPVDSLRG
jgi:putative ABC transport system permease protein